MRIAIENENPITFRDKSGHIGQFSGALALLKKIADEFSLRRKEEQLILISHPYKTKFVNLGHVGGGEKKQAGLLGNPERLFQDYGGHFFGTADGTDRAGNHQADQQTG
jgi:hypothetical protein